MFEELEKRKQEEEEEQKIKQNENKKENCKKIREWDLFSSLSFGKEEEEKMEQIFLSPPLQSHFILLKISFSFPNKNAFSSLQLVSQKDQLLSEEDNYVVLESKEKSVFQQISLFLSSSNDSSKNCFSIFTFHLLRRFLFQKQKLVSSSSSSSLSLSFSFENQKQLSSLHPLFSSFSFSSSSSSLSSSSSPPKLSSPLPNQLPMSDANYLLVISNDKEVPIFSSPCISFLEEELKKEKQEKVFILKLCNLFYFYSSPHSSSKSLSHARNILSSLLHHTPSSQSSFPHLPSFTRLLQQNSLSSSLSSYQAPLLFRLEEDHSFTCLSSPFSFSSLSSSHIFFLSTPFSLFLWIGKSSPLSLRKNLSSIAFKKVKFFLFSLFYLFSFYFFYFLFLFQLFFKFFVIFLLYQWSSLEK